MKGSLCSISGNIYEKEIYTLLKQCNINGDMHDTFDHDKLYKCLSGKKDWLMTYNNCDYIKELYKDYKIIETKESSEIVIIG
jgi:hypothetical protein